MPSAEIDDLEAVRLLVVRDDREAEVAPNLVLRGLLGILDTLACKSARSLRSKSPPSVPSATSRATRFHASAQLDLVAQIAAGLLQAPDECPRIEPGDFPRFFVHSAI
jgi:hypothetical protein